MDSRPPDDARSDDPGLTVRELAGAKHLPEAMLRGVRVHDLTVRGTPMVGIPYFDLDGNETALRHRLALDGSARFRWRTGSKVLLYGLQRLREARAAGWILLVEGESDTWTAWFHELPCAGLPGKMTWQEAWARHLDGLDVYLWMESDAPELVERVHQDLPAVKVIRAPDGIKDLNDAHIQFHGDRTAFKTWFDRIRAEAQSSDDVLRAVREEQRRKTAEEALPHARDLLDAPDLMGRIAHALDELGLAGDKEPALVIYLAMVSRLLARPVNFSVEGPSSGGKTHTVSTVLQLFPESAFYRLTSSSPLALVYLGKSNREVLRNKMLVIGEASGLQKDGVGASIMRAIAWEGRVVHDTVGKVDGTMEPIHLDLAGPTGVLTTTVKALDSELATRFLSVPVRDDPVQTRTVLRETAKRAEHGSPPMDLRPFLEAQEWLSTGGATHVSVPFAQALAELVDASTVRARRDFPQTLALIQACALLHQRQRSRDARGWVIASLEDYRIVHRLASQLFPEPSGLTEAQREATVAVDALCAETQEAVMYRQVADRLQIDQSAAMRRLAKPLREGFVVNEEDRRGRPAKLRPGAPLPTPHPSLPTPAELEGATCPVEAETDCRPADGGSDPLWDKDFGPAEEACSPPATLSQMQTAPAVIESVCSPSAEGLQTPTAGVEALENKDFDGVSAGLQLFSGDTLVLPLPGPTNGDGAASSRTGETPHALSSQGPWLRFVCRPCNSMTLGRSMADAPCPTCGRPRIQVGKTAHA